MGSSWHPRPLGGAFQASGKRQEKVMNNVVNLRAHANVPLIPTLVLLDLQQEYTASPRLFSIPDIETALENCHSALSLARELGLPVAFLRLIGRAPFFSPALS